MNGDDHKCDHCDGPNASPFTHDWGAEEALCPTCRGRAIAYDAAQSYMRQLLRRAVTEWMEVYGDNEQYVRSNCEEITFNARKLMDDAYEARYAPTPVANAAD